MNALAATITALSLLVSGIMGVGAPLGKPQLGGNSTRPIDMQSAPADSGAVCRLPHEQTNLEISPLREIPAGSAILRCRQTAPGAVRLARGIGPAPVPPRTLQASCVRLQI